MHCYVAIVVGKYCSVFDEAEPHHPNAFWVIESPILKDITPNCERYRRERPSTLDTRPSTTNNLNESTRQHSINAMVIRKASRLVASFVVTSRGAGSLTTTSLVVGRLNDPSLLDWNKAPASSSSFAVYDPASPNTVLAEVQGVDTREAIEKSKNALGSWRDDTTASFRSACLLEWSRLLKSNSEDLATIMTLESGKPLAESRGEVNYAASFLDYYAAEAIRSTGAGGGFMVPSPFATPSGGPKGNVLAVQQAVGVCALITPWNFPMAMITRKAGPALAVGCTAIVKPSELTPLSAIALENLAIQAGIPSDVFQVV